MNTRRSVWCIDLGVMDFPRVHSLQLEIVDARISGKIGRDVVLLLEHPPVFTIGRRGGRAHLKVSSSFLKDAGMDLLHIERGGDITFHGPGQLVLYPIFQLRRAGLGVVDFVRKLEEVMLRSAMDAGVSSERNVRNHGIWVGDRKLGFVGIAVRRSTSFHGIALNVDLPLIPFTWIDPCGLENVHVTSLNLEADYTVKIDEMKMAFRKHLEDIFSIDLKVVTLDKLKDLFLSNQH